MLDYEIISSSSNGNCLIFNKYLAIDMGISFKKISPYLKNLKVILLTHEHTDHFDKTCIKMIAYNKPTLKWLCGDWLVKSLIDLGVSKKNIYVVESGKTYDLGLFRVMPIETYHDVRNMSYKVDFKPITIYYATDTKKLDYLDCLKGLDYYFVENNYRDDIINFHIQEAKENNDINKLFYLERTLKNHLSKSDCDSFLIENMTNNSSYVYLHISKYNNTKNGDFDT